MHFLRNTTMMYRYDVRETSEKRKCAKSYERLCWYRKRMTLPLYWLGRGKKDVTVIKGRTSKYLYEMMCIARSERVKKIVRHRQKCIMRSKWSPMTRHDLVRQIFFMLLFYPSVFFPVASYNGIIADCSSGINGCICHYFKFQFCFFYPIFSYLFHFFPDEKRNQP